MQLLFLTAHVIFVSITTVGCFLRLTPDVDVLYKDDVYIRLKDGKRTHRSTENSFPPPTYDFDLRVAGLKLNVHLTRNDDLSTNVPTLTLKRGSFKPQILHDNEDSVFYQDINHGAVFVVQEDRTKAKNMFGVFNVEGEEYVLQTQETNRKTLLKKGYNKFQIFKRKSEYYIQ